MSKGYFLVFLTAFISGISIFLNKMGVSIANPYIYTFWRVWLVSIFLTSLLFILKDWQKFKTLSKKQWMFLILIGLVGGSIPFLLFFKGLSLTTSVKGSFIHKTMFLFVAILASLFLKEKIEKKFFIGGFLLFLGNLILLKKLPSPINLGDLLVFLATLLWAVENTISKYLLQELEGRQVAWGRMFFGSLFIFLFLLATNQLPFLVQLNQKQVFWILLTSFLLFGYVMSWYSGLKSIPVSQATVILLLGGPITTFLSLIFETKITFPEILSALLVVGGVIVVVGIKETLRFLKEIKNIIYVRI